MSTNNALTRQEGGDHYKSQAIQPVEYIHANGIGYFEGNVIKYVTRWKAKGGLADLRKAQHYIELLIELEKAKEPKPPQPVAWSITPVSGGIMPCAAQCDEELPS